MVRIQMTNETPHTKPYPGKATIRDQADRLEIEVPAKANGLQMAGIFLWLVLWSGGLIAFLVMILRQFLSGEGYTALGLLPIWGVMALAGFLVFKVFYWMAKGKEVIVLSGAGLTIQNKGALRSAPMLYALSSIQSLRVTVPLPGIYRTRLDYYFRRSPYGRIAFDYQGRSIKFGEEIGPHEAQYLVGLLQSRLSAYL